MTRFLSLSVLALFALMPCRALPQSSMMSTQIGVGPHGYDFAIGTWSCTNSMPSAMSGPATTTLTLARSPQGSLMFHSTGGNFDSVGYVAYNAKTKTWWNPGSVGDGSYSIESTMQSGPKSVWTGTFFNAATRKTTPIRDTYNFSATKYTDITQVQAGGAWKTVANIACTKS
jgi:hypothetical protein